MKAITENHKLNRVIILDFFPDLRRDGADAWGGGADKRGGGADTWRGCAEKRDGGADA